MTLGINCGGVSCPGALAQVSQAVLSFVDAHVELPAPPGTLVPKHGVAAWGGSEYSERDSGGRGAGARGA
jgi:hypothetical protein